MLNVLSMGGDAAFFIKLYTNFFQVPVKGKFIFFGGVFYFFPGLFFRVPGP